MNLYLPTHSSWWQKLMLWFRLKKLEHQLRSSRKFQTYCQKIGFKNLAGLEALSGEQIHKRIEQLKADLSGSRQEQPIKKNLSADEMRSDGLMGGSFWVLPPVTPELESNVQKIAKP